MLQLIFYFLFLESLFNLLTKIVFICTLIGLPFILDLYKLVSRNCSKKKVNDSKTGEPSKTKNTKEPSK